MNCRPTSLNARQKGPRKPPRHHATGVAGARQNATQGSAGADLLVSVDQSNRVSYPIQLQKTAQRKLLKAGCPPAPQGARACRLMRKRAPAVITQLERFP